MSSYYGWSYAHQVQHPCRRTRGTKQNRYRKPGRKSVVLKMDRTLPGQDWNIGKVGRLLVVVILVVLSLIVLGKDQTLRMEIAAGMQNVWQQTLGRIRQDAVKPSAPRPAAGAQETTIPGEQTVPKALQVKPFALVLDKSMFVLDETGSIWPLLDERVPADLPIITGILVREEPGEMGVMVRAELDMDMLKKIVRMPYRDQISEIHFGSREGVVLYTRSAIKVLLRQSRLLDRDLKRLGAVLGDIRIKGNKIALVDLRYNQHVVVRPKSRR